MYCPCFIIKNKTESILYLKPNPIMINNESYIVFIQSDIKFCRLNPQSNQHYIDCKNEIYKFYHDHWLNIAEGGEIIELLPYNEKIFPLKIFNGLIHALSNPKRNSKLFNAKKKLVFTFNIKDKDYEYAINLDYCYNVYLNYLAFYDRSKDV